jgi:hypothetical protein
MILQFKQLSKYAVTAVLVVLCVLFYAVKKVNAIPQTTLTGSCGLLINYNYNGWDNIITERSGSQITKSAIGVVNFDTLKTYFELTVNTNYGGGNFNGTTPSEAVVKITGDAVFNSYDSETGIYKYTVTVVNTNETTVFTVLPVNSGNTYLISGHTPVLGLADGPGISGVCQKI